MSNMNFTCDVCGREILGCNIVNGMKFCAKCYQETFGANKDWQLLDKDKEIANLQSQLSITEKALELACYNHIMQVFDKDKININEKVKEYILFYMEKAKELKGKVEE